jgi:hypothetical protein
MTLKKLAKIAPSTSVEAICDWTVYGGKLNYVLHRPPGWPLVFIGTLL